MGFALTVTIRYPPNRKSLIYDHKTLYWWASQGGLPFEKAGDAGREIWRPICILKDTLTGKRFVINTLSETRILDIYP